MADNLRIGIGWDAHPFAAGRRLVLGGVDFAGEAGLDGWSDADVLTHAVMDALLGAAALGDIGGHFPPGSPEYRDVSSLSLLVKVGEQLGERGWVVVNIDATVLAEQPKLAGSIGRMREKLSGALGIGVSQISIKASTANRLGFIGRGEGIAALAVALIKGGENEGL